MRREDDDDDDDDDVVGVGKEPPMECRRGKNTSK